jgi:hypothetical protein
MHVLDDHPITWLFDLETNTPLLRRIDYFAHGERGRGWPDTYLGNRGRTPDTMPEKHERLHSLADVFGSLSAAGLVVTHLGEHSDLFWDVLPNLPLDVKRGLPMTFTMGRQARASAGRVATPVADPAVPAAHRRRSEGYERQDQRKRTGYEAEGSVRREHREPYLDHAG